jgi:hypothetical protein
MLVNLRESACQKDLRDGEASANALVTVVHCNVSPNVDLRFTWVEECTSAAAFGVLHSGFHQPLGAVACLERAFSKLKSLGSMVRHTLCQAVLRTRHCSDAFGSRGWGKRLMSLVDSFLKSMDNVNA